MNLPNQTQEVPLDLIVENDELQPNARMIRRHLELLGAERGDVIEIALENRHQDGQPRAGRSFGHDELETAAGWAAKMNSAGRNLYLPPAMRKPYHSASGRSSKQHVRRSRFVWVDIDDAEAAERAVAGGWILPPTFYLITGRTPGLRVHAFWKLGTPVTDLDRIKSVNQRLAATMGGDKQPVGYSSLMKLAGCVVWPRKEGRVGEIVELVRP